MFHICYSYHWSILIEVFWWHFEAFFIGRLLICDDVAFGTLWVKYTSFRIKYCFEVIKLFLRLLPPHVQHPYTLVCLWVVLLKKFSHRHVYKMINPLTTFQRKHPIKNQSQKKHIHIHIHMHMYINLWLCLWVSVFIFLTHKQKTLS